MLTRVAFTPFPHLFLFLSLLYGHRLHPRLRFLLFLPQLLLHISVLLLIPATNPQNDYIFGVVTFFVLINTSSLFLFTPDPWSLRRLTSPPFTSLSTWNRIKWAGELATISRGIGWNFQITPIFPTLGTTKRSFLLGVVKRILMLQAIYEVSLWYLSTVGNTPGVTEDLLQRVKTSAAMMAWSWHSIEFPYLLFILLCIFTGLLFLDPRESPQMFGQITQIYSVRRFWGRGWHQGLRRMFQVHGRWVAGKLGAKKGGKVAGYIQVWVAFAISGVGHAVGVYAVDHRAGWGLMVGFFLAQAVAIMYEDAVIEGGKRLRVSARLGRWVGRAWVVVWFLGTWPWLNDELRQYGVVGAGRSWTGRVYG